MRWLSLAGWLIALGVHAECAPASDSQRVAVAGGSITEVIYFLGLQDRIVATDTTSNFPAAASEFPSVGYVRNLSTEGILSLNPSVLLGEDDMGPPEVVAQLHQTGLPVVKITDQHSVQGVLGKLECIAQVLSLSSQNTEAAYQGLQPVVEQLAQVSEASSRSPKVAFLLNISNGVPLAAGEDTSAHGLLNMMGAQNAFADVTGWKPVSLEALVQADPEFIIMPTRGVAAAGGSQAVLQHAAVRLTRAGRDQALLEMDGMAMLGFGPRTLDSATQLARRIGTLPAP